jgi:hypothetical protein
MNKPWSRLLALFILSLSTICTSSAQSRSQIDIARDLLKNNNCDAAIIKLEGVDAELQETAEYLLTMARAHDCKEHLPEAISYYKRYLEQKKDDSVKKRYDALVSAKHVKEKSTVINEQYRASSGIRHKKRASVGNGYFLGYSFGFQIPLSSSPYAYDLQYAVDMGIPIQPKKISAIFTGAITYYGSAQKGWLQKMAGSTYKVNQFEEGWGYDITIRIPYWLKNDGDIAWGIAPKVGYKKIMMSDPNAFGPNKLVLPKIGGATLGLEGVLAMNSGITIHAGYCWYKVSKPALAPDAPPFTVNYSSVTLKLSYGRWKR